VDNLISRQRPYYHHPGSALAREASDVHGNSYRLPAIGVRMLFIWMPPWLDEAIRIVSSEKSVHEFILIISVQTTDEHRCVETIQIFSLDRVQVFYPKRL
jgi:hypothetical protein